MKILHVAQPTTGGVAEYVAQAAAHQASKGSVVAVAAPADGELRRSLAQAGVTHLHWPATRGYRTVMRERSSLLELVHAWGPEVVHLHSSKAGLVGRLTVRGTIPTVFQPHAWSFHASRVPVAALWERVALRWTSALVCVSESERLEGERRSIIHPGAMVVVKNGVDLDRFRPADADARAAARRALAIGPEPLAVCVGRIAEQKGQDRLLRVWPAVRRQVPGAALSLVGDGPLRAELEGQRVEGVDFRGHSDDVRSWLAAADVVVLPSRWEGMSLALVEAAAMGKSIVATDVAGVREVLGDTDGVADDVGPHFADAVVARLADPALAAAEGARAHRRSRGYDVRETFRRLSEVYELVAGGWSAA